MSYGESTKDDQPHSTAGRIQLSAWSRGGGAGTESGQSSKWELLFGIWKLLEVWVWEIDYNLFSETYEEHASELQT